VNKARFFRVLRAPILGTESTITVREPMQTDEQRADEVVSHDRRPQRPEARREKRVHRTQTRGARTPTRSIMRCPFNRSRVLMLLCDRLEDAPHCALAPDRFLVQQPRRSS